MKLAQNPDVGGSLLSALTPTEYAELFPKYYQRQLPDVEGFSRAITKRTVTQQKESDDQLRKRLVELEKSNSEVRQGMERLGVSSGKEPAKLTEEQSAAYSTLQAGDININSEQGQIFKGMTDEQLSSVGISVVTNDKGEKLYHYTAPVTGREEAESRLRTSGGKEGSLKANQGIAYQAAIAEGLPPDGARALVANMSRESLANPSLKRWDRKHYSQGIVQWDDNRSEAIKNHFGKYPMDMSIQEQVKASLWEMKSRGYSSVYNKLMDSSVSGSEKIHALVHDYEKPQYADLETKRRIDLLSSINTQGEAVKPEGPNGQYSDTQISSMITQLGKEKSEARKQQLANILQGQGVNVPQTTGAPARAPGSVIGGTYGSGQCVALSKHFAPQVGPASGWKINYDPSGSGIKPGTVIATTSYNDGSGGKMARNMPDHRSHYHTGIALTAPDEQGNVLILDQSLGKASQIHKINIHNYNGEKWGIVPNGGPTPRSMQAVHMSMAGASESERRAISDSISGQQPTAQATATTQDVKRVAEAPNTVPRTQQKQDTSQDGEKNTPQQQEVSKKAEPDTKQSKQETTQEQPAKTAEVVKDKKVEADKKQSEQTATPQVQNKSTSFMFNKEAYLNEVGEKQPLAYSFVGPGREGVWKETSSGLAAAEKEGVIKWDRKTNEVSISDMNHPRVKEIFGDMEKYNLDRNKFMKPLKGAARGGKFDVPDGGLTAYKAKESKDNTLVVDKNQNPLFTMNDKESATFDPSNNKVNIDPTIKSKGDIKGQQPTQQMGNEAVLESINSLRSDISKKEQNTSNVNPINIIRNPTGESSAAVNNLHDMTSTPYLNPAMHRAVSRVGGEETGSAIGNRHFSFGNKNG